MKVELYVGYADYTWDIKTIPIVSSINVDNSETIKSIAKAKFIATLSDDEKERIMFVGIYNITKEEDS